MNLSERIKSLSGKYIFSFMLGVSFPFMAKTSWRKGLEVDEDLVQFYKNRIGFSDDENFIGYFKENERKGYVYVVGMAVGLLSIVSGLLKYSTTQIESKGDPTVLLATAGALTVGNIASILYERRGNSKHKDIIDGDIQNF